MADLTSITAVRPTANTQMRPVVYGATIAAGQPIYLDTTDNEYKLADADLTITTAECRGIAMTPGIDGGMGYMAFGGSIILVGTTMAVGTEYFASDTAGGIRPVGDIDSGDWPCRLGNASTTTQLDLDIIFPGNQVP